MSARTWLAVVITFAVAGIGIADVQAQPAPETVSSEVIEVSATTGKSPSIDAELKPLEKKLKKPPFLSWNQFHVLLKTQQSLVKHKPATIKLKVGSATITLIEIVDKSKCRVSVTIEDPKGKQLVNNTAAVEAGDFLVYGHSLPNNDGHLLALTCK